MSLSISIRNKLRHWNAKLVLYFDICSCFKPILFIIVVIWVRNCHSYLKYCLSRLHSFVIDAWAVERRDKYGLVLIFFIVSYDLGLEHMMNSSWWVWVTLWKIRLQNVLLRTIPIERYWCNTICESLIVILKHCNLFEHTSSINISLLIKWYFYRCDKSHSNWYSSLRNNSLLFLAIFWELCLLNTVDEFSVTNFQPSYFSKFVYSCNFLIYDLEVLFNVTSFNLLTIRAPWWSS